MASSEELKFEQIMLVQKHQLDQGSDKLGEVDDTLDQLTALLDESDSELEILLATAQQGLSDLGLVEEEGFSPDLDVQVQRVMGSRSVPVEGVSIRAVSKADLLDFDEQADWASYQLKAKAYAQSQGLDLSGDPFDRLLTDQQRIAIEKRIQDEFTLKTAQCDKYDYLVAGTCGVIGGLVDVCFVGMPGEGKLTKVTDSAVDSAVEKFAGAFGWKGEKDGADSTKSAIGYLERNFKVNYDQATTVGTDGAVKNLSPKNHHLKSLGHSPDLIGLFFSILNQFTDTSTFVSNGKIITIDTETYELKGGNFIAKVFSGFVNWLGHLFSDMAGSSGASTRGAGIPIPFYNLLLLLDVGEFGQNKQSFATIATQVFEKGYDMRHGMAMAIPVLITELLTRLMWTCKQRFYHNKAWKECIPSASKPELRRMLLVSHGTLCLIDTGDAALKSGGDMVQFLLRTNIIGWARFGSLALKEVYAWHNSGNIDAEAVDEYLDDEYEKMLAAF